MHNVAITIITTKTSNLGFKHIKFVRGEGSVPTQKKDNKSRQLKKTPQVTETEYNVDAKSISNDDVKSWRDELKVKDDKEILVAQWLGFPYFQNFLVLMLHLV